VLTSPARGLATDRGPQYTATIVEYPCGDLSPLEGTIPVPDPTPQSPHERYDAIIATAMAEAQARGESLSKIALIKVLREHTGIGLSEAKLAVERYGTGRVESYDEILTGALRDLKSPDKIWLIKELREHTGLGLKQAKEIVEDYGRRHAIEWPMSKFGCLLLCAEILIGLVVAVLTAL
jgi:ribosomal protein L7/L12